MTIAFLFASLFVLMLIGVPIAISLGLAGSLTIVFFSPDSVRSLAIKLFETSEHYTLLAIPFFLLAGAFMTTGGVARRLIDFANACVGHIRGGLAIAAVLACMLFAALSGSSPATVAAVGSIAIAGMVRSGYPQAFGAGIVCNAGTLGILIPPSIVMVVYAAATETSVGKLFMAGVLPGLLLGLALMVAIYIVAVKKKLPAMPRATFREWLGTARKAIWGLLLMFIILGGIYSGMFTPTEAAAVAAVYSAFIALFVYKDLTFRETPKVLLDSAKLSIMLMFIIANAMLFAHVLTTEQLPQQITVWVIEAGLTPMMFLLVVNIVLLIAGAFMEPSAIILILAPILFPIAMKLGIDPIHLGIIMVVNLEIGLITPPVGLNLFVTSAVTGMTLPATIRAAMPWLMILFLFLILITYVPWISLALPNWLGMS
ncbi:MAG: C4-dicarboxylate TRAP transporter large permease protein DctM [Pseudomonas sp.]|jgi:C4-dicarboxylate transporter DctM subunit|uniref:TRAP transporter large permease protein n=3 Tax=Pseudomonas fluorescens group TaxID=136843 RepID=A0AB36CZK0_9PSED|nr:MULTISPECIES: C4-dicarboxylate TRAP transporter large permease protein DctM [Pseudomonas]MBU0522732.1 C4-dicarboxylate TRAP transporter large permease protein DctM [Gammaproteobacteria bacterium]MDF9880760.1 C4-dicarboxylate transporter DctM subunit [Pseudomonas silensiensis]AHZ67232.1 C4-dicarboxylate transporter [Pseudomonas mandelii JR-1]MBU0821849.1 C4-dicarboxylate TRAP transporter large permease protein DctM [Gammaproteobacteria bacterium]MBU0843962.1 C4-dicarboxylate TRAP transporter